MVETALALESLTLGVGDSVNNQCAKFYKMLAVCCNSNSKCCASHFIIKSGSVQNVVLDIIVCLSTDM